MKETFCNLKKVYQYGKGYKKNFVIFTVISFFSVAINILFPILSARELVALSSSLYKELLIAAFLCFFMSILIDFTTIVLRKNMQFFFRKVTQNIQIKLAREILKIDLSVIDQKGSGTFIQRIDSDTYEMSSIFTKGMRCMTAILTDIGIYVAIFIINKIVFCYFLFCSILLTTLHLIESRKMDVEDKKCRKQRERLSSLVGELVRGIRDIKMLYAKDSFMEEIDENIDRLNSNQFRLRDVEVRYDFMIDIVFEFCEIIMIVLFIFLMSHSYLSVASALVLYNYRFRVFGNLMVNIGDLLKEIKGFNLSCNRVFSILDNDEFKKESFGGEQIDKIHGDFSFEDVHFGYGDHEILKGLSFQVHSNETVAFVGKSGAGKTTIFSLLCKLYDISSGRILLDGKDIRTLDEKSIRNNITIISQNPYIFNMSIRDNFKLVKKNVTDKEIEEACKLACLDTFIHSLDDGYDTIVGEGGVTLSGGQRQRLAIARAFVQDTKIILFDEATSALDNETQEFIQKAIHNMKDKYTILIIAHRLSTIVNADRIMLVDDGKVIASGTHKELIAGNKFYKKLYENEILNH